MGKEHFKFIDDNQPPAHWLDRPFPWAATAGKMITGALFGFFSFYFISRIALFSLPLANFVLPLAASSFLAYLGYVYLFRAIMCFIFGEHYIANVNITNLGKNLAKKITRIEYKHSEGLLGIPYKTTVAEFEGILHNELQSCLIDDERDKILLYTKLFAKKLAVEKKELTSYFYPSTIDEISAKTYLTEKNTDMKSK